MDKEGENWAGKWCWREHQDAEGAVGPFDTRADAIADAVADLKLEAGDTVLIGWCDYPQAAKFVDADLDWILEQMDERAVDDGFWDGGDGVFDPIDRDMAEKALELAMAKWAQEHIKAIAFTTKAERLVVIGGDDRG